MAIFQLYNYQFGKIVSEETNNLFNEKTAKEISEENFPLRQEIFGKLFKNDYDRTSPIVFTNISASKDYAHKHLMPPTDGIIILRVANVRKRQIVQSDFKVKQEADFINCLIIIDNRDGIQRIAIEQNKSVFKDINTLVNIFKHSINKILRPYGLLIELYQLQNSCDFWRCVNDKREYPNGFYKLIFKLPHLNLDRLTKKIDKIATLARKSYDSDMTIEMTANKGGSLNLSENDPLQKAQIEYMTEDLGGNSVIMVPADNKRSKINIRTMSQKTTSISNTIFTQIQEDAAGNTLFKSDALDEVKRKTTIGI